MSYILSALRKAESERRSGGSTADTSPARAFTVVADGEPALSVATSHGFWLALGVVVIASAAGFYSFQSKQESKAIAVAPPGLAVSQAPKAQTQDTQTQQSQANESAATETAVPEAAAPEITGIATTSPETVVESGGSPASQPSSLAKHVAPAAGTASPVVAVQGADPDSQLSSNSQSRAPDAAGNGEPLPPINVTGYIFFEDNPGNSKLFVDGIVYRQHSRLGDNLTIEEFHRDHVVLRHRGGLQQLRIH